MKFTKRSIQSAGGMTWSFLMSAQICCICAINTLNSKDPQNFFTTERIGMKLLISVLAVLPILCYTHEYYDEVSVLLKISDEDDNDTYLSLEDGKRESEVAEISCLEKIFTLGFSENYSTPESSPPTTNKLPRKMFAITFPIISALVLAYIAWHQAKLIGDAFDNDNILFLSFLFILRLSAVLLDSRHGYEIIAGGSTEYSENITKNKAEKFSKKRSITLLLLLLITHIPFTVLQNENVIQKSSVFGIPSDTIEYLGMFFIALIEALDHLNHTKTGREGIRTFQKYDAPTRAYITRRALTEGSIPAASDSILFLINVFNRPFSPVKKSLFAILAVLCGIGEGGVEFLHFLQHAGRKAAENYTSRNPVSCCTLFQLFDDKEGGHDSLEMLLLEH